MHVELVYHVDRQTCFGVFVFPTVHFTYIIYKHVLVGWRPLVVRAFMLVSEETPPANNNVRKQNATLLELTHSLIRVRRK